VNHDLVAAAFGSNYSAEILISLSAHKFVYTEKCGIILNVIFLGIVRVRRMVESHQTPRDGSMQRLRSR
jgi:hypothetical protein